MNYVNQETGESRSLGCRGMGDGEDAVPYIRYEDTLACPFVGGDGTVDGGGKWVDIMCALRIQAVDIFRRVW